VAGVIGYAAAKRMPPRIAPSALASLPETSQRRFDVGIGGEPQIEFDCAGGAVARRDCRVAGLDGSRSFVSQPLFDQRIDDLGIEAEQFCRDAERDHVGPSIRNGLRHVLERDFDDAGAGGGHHRRQVTATRIADHQAVRTDVDFGSEALGVEPIDADQDIVAIGQAFHRPRGKPHHRGGFTAPNLRADRAREEPVPPGRAGRFQQEVARGQRASPAASDEGH
jgi:hypothetical protein